MNDGWRQVKTHHCLEEICDQASHGNVALTGEIELSKSGGEAVLAIGFGSVFAEAAHNARAGLLEDFERTLAAYSSSWRAFHEQCLTLEAPRRDTFDLYRTSTTVLRIHESKRFHGGVIASLSIPWGQTKGDKDIGGYHVVWPRDQFHAAMAMLASGNVASARQTLFYLMTTQDADGGWPQNMWVDGAAYRRARQSDQTGAFLILAHRLEEDAALGDIDPWPAVKKAAEKLLQEGPVTDQDRWEENRGYTPYTLGLIIAGLIVAADFAERRGDDDLAGRCRKTADTWNECLDCWLYVRGTALARRVGVDGYYVRLAPPEVKDPEDLKRLTVTLKNYDPPEKGTFRAAEIVSPDALALVRYGLRAPNDLRIENTVKVIDAVLRTETTSGPAWRRFNHDGYGETLDGKPFDGKNGIGRSWPLLTGERAHYELARGNREEAERLLEAFARQASAEGLFPEQIWDREDIPDRDLFNGQPSGSAMPLVWAHAEFVTLLRSLKSGYIFDCPRLVQERYAATVAENH